MSPIEIEKYTTISRLPVKRVVKRKGLKQFKRLKTPQISEATKKRTERASFLVERITKNSRSIGKCVWQNEEDFTLEVLLNLAFYRIAVFM